MGNKTKLEPKIVRILSDFKFNQFCRTWILI